MAPLPAVEGIDPERVLVLHDAPVQPGRYVLLWLQAAVRSRCHHALEYAIGQANRLGRPVVACFGLTPAYPEASERHYAFLLEGLADAGAGLRERGIPLIAREGDPPAAAADLAADACMVVADRGYLRHQEAWRRQLAGAIEAPLVQVESDAVVPVDLASGKEEYAASTLRPKIHRLLDRFLVTLPERDVRVRMEDPGWDTLPWQEPGRVLSRLRIDRPVPPARGFRGGQGEARRRLAVFLRERLDRYPADRNDPARDALSGMSPYLHFGQVSPLEVALAVLAAGGPGAGPFLEEIIVRRELSLNFVRYNPQYDSCACLPAWARGTLARHTSDRREYVYSPEELERAVTHDPAWNAAQREMVVTGKMHGYLRMYWGKQILAWTETPGEALRIALALNNRYELDGRDPNGYAGVAWCFGKHDRPWGERPVFGTVRSMTAGGLARKFDVDAYIRRAGGMPGSSRARGG